MKARPRRLLLFVGMVVSGLVALYLLSDPFTSRGRARVGELTDENASERIRIVDPEAEGETTVSLGNVEFELAQMVEVAPGQEEERAVYRVRIASGKPDEDGNILAENPEITILDHVTGEGTGTLRADEATFVAEGAVGGQVTLDFGRMRSTNFTLSGDVRGRFTLSDGEPAELEAESMRVRGPLVTAPGRVTWRRPELAVDGQDMTWDDETGALDLRSDAHLVLEPSDGRPSYRFDAPSGLSVIVPPEGAPADERARAELRGPVTGTSSDGGRIEADTLRVDAVTGLVTLQGSSLFERETEEGLARLTARNLSVRTDDEGRIRIAEADGGVRLVHAPVALMPASLATESLRLVDDQAHAPGPVTWDRADLQAKGHEMDWDLAGGILSFTSDAEIALAAESGHPLAGLRLVAPGGMSWTLPPGTSDPMAGASGHMTGGVTGSLPDGTTLAADVLLFDGPTGTFRLEGSAGFRQEHDDGFSQLDAHHITVETGGDGRIALVTADGEVLVVTGPVDVLPTQLEGEHLVSGNGRLRSEGRVTWSRGDLRIAGTGMTVDEANGRLEFDREASIDVREPDGSLSLEAYAEGGLTWQVPFDAADPAGEGRGVLRGRVTCTTADGSLCRADRLIVDGPAGTVRLSGACELTTPEQMFLQAEEILLVEHDELRRMEVPGPARWELPDASGRGTGLTWDDVTRTLHVERDVHLTLATEWDGAPWELVADGSLTWQRPEAPATGTALPGTGELRGNVRGQHPSSGEFQTGHLLVDGREGRITLLGPSTYQAAPAADRADPTGAPPSQGSGGMGADGLFLQAQTRIAFETDPGGPLRRIRAEGDARARLPPSGSSPPPVLSAQWIELDDEARTVTLRGGALVETVDGDLPMRISAGERLLGRLDEQDALSWVEATGGVVFDRDFRIESDAMHWNVAADEAMLSGSCMLRYGGATMLCDRVELQPRARTFRILRSAVQLDG
ncbi:MAG: hypothetical protein ACYTG2_09820 [Planctomycetota bacterium]|jgi:hypothetical protein